MQTKEPADNKPRCDTCGIDFVLESTLESHNTSFHKKKQKSRAKPHPTCPYCQKVFRKERCRDEHVAAVHEDKPCYICTLCHTTFQKEQDYKRHMEMHTSPQYQCDVCGISFPFQRDLLSHKREIHPTPFQCQQCGKSFSRRENLQTHMHTHQKPKEERKTFLCTIPGCGASFTRKSNLTTHMETIHGGVAPYACEKCGKAFRYKSLLEKHKWTHEDTTVPIIELKSEELILDPPSLDQ